MAALSAGKRAVLWVVVSVASTASNSADLLAEKLVDVSAVKKVGSLADSWVAYSAA